MKKIIECVPNFSEGRNKQTIKAITDAISAVEGVTLLDVDPGFATNRTVVTFVGEPEAVIEGAFQGFKKAAELIDMRQHSGEHARMGATDVCPLIPISGISMEETVEYAKQLAQRVGEELQIPIFLYESAATKPDRKNLATIRAGEYEGMAEKLRQSNWKPDFGPEFLNLKAGASVIGARDFLVAYNINLNTKSTRIANAIAFDVREAGRIKREGHPVLGKVVTDRDGEPVRIPGTLKSVKAVGWYIEEYGIAQISMNLTDLNEVSVHQAFDEVCRAANERGVRVTGSELVGLVPKKTLTDAGIYYLEKQGRSAGVSETELIDIAVKSLGLAELTPFDAKKKVIEYLLETETDSRLVNMNLVAFANETASESPAPGGGSIAAYVGALGASLSSMVANLSAGKRGWEDKLEYFSLHAVESQQIKQLLLQKVDEDTRAFDAIMQAFALPNNNEEEKAARSEAIQEATINATLVPFEVMKIALGSMKNIAEMALKGNPNSVTDAGVAALCARTAVYGAFLNVKVNALGWKDKTAAHNLVEEAQALLNEAISREQDIMEMVAEKLV